MSARKSPPGPAPSPRTGRPRSQVARARILAAAVALTREAGFEALAMEAVAARAGVGKATVYRWWPSKELLLAEAVAREVRLPVPDSGAVVDDVTALMRTLVRIYRDPGTTELLPALVAAMARSGRVAAAVRGGMLAAWRDAMATVVRRGIARGELGDSSDVLLILDLLSAPLFYRTLMLGLPVDDAYALSVVQAVLPVRARASSDGGAS